MRRERATFTHIPTINHKSIILHFATSDFSSLFFHIIFEVVKVYVFVDLVKWGVLRFVGEVCCYRSGHYWGNGRDQFGIDAVLWSLAHPTRQEDKNVFCNSCVVSKQSPARPKPMKGRWSSHVGNLCGYKTFAFDRYITMTLHPLVSSLWWC